MLSDPLSQIFALVDAKSALSTSLVTGGEWALSFPVFRGIKCNAVVKGECWLSIAGVQEPVRLGQGDAFVLTGGHEFVLSSDLQVSPASAVQIFRQAKRGVAQYGPHSDVVIIGGRVDVDPLNGQFLLGALPPIILIRSASDSAEAIQWSLRRLSSELEGLKPGSELAGSSLIQLLVIEALRSYLAGSEAPELGWLAAMRDPRIAEALREIHQDPTRAWTVHDLAIAAGMSRSGFSQQFRTLIGTSPLDYLLQWRMRLAAKQLRTTDEAVSAIGFRLGYATESGFSSAFKRVVGLAPAVYRKEVVCLQKTDPSNPMASKPKSN
jgi:AraC-like DNA-binding protein